MLDLLAANPFLTLMVVVAAGAALGKVPFGPLRLGAAGALFVGLALGAVDERLGEGLGLVQVLGLALFVYTVGLASGSTFFRDLRRQLPLMGVGAGALLVAAALSAGTAKVLGVDGPLLAGAYVGGLTSTPGLAAAQAAAGSGEPAVGYALGYPVGVVVALLVVSALVGRSWPGPRDPAPAASAGLVAVTAAVRRPTTLAEVPGYAEQAVRMSYLARDGKVRVIRPDEELRPGDEVVVVGPGLRVESAVEHLGDRLEGHLAHDRRSVDFERFVVSDKRLAGRSLAELDLPGRFDGVVTRVRRGDLDLLGRDDLTLELGDRVLAVVPRERLREVKRFFGDSERGVSQFDPLSAGIGLGLGIVVGLVAIPLPGGVAVALGSAAGPLVVGMVLGHVERTGRLVWGMPLYANLAVRQLGLFLFLAAVGLASGEAFAERAFTPEGAAMVATAAVAVGAACALTWLGAKAVGVSAPRAGGAIAGLIGQPALLAHAISRATDERVESGYAALFALAILVKILVVQSLVLV